MIRILGWGLAALMALATAAGSVALWGLPAAIAVTTAVAGAAGVGRLQQDRWRRRTDVLRQDLDRIRRADMVIEKSITWDEAAREAVVLARELTGASGAAVVIEQDTQTIRAVDDEGASVYGTGSEFRLLEANGAPCGSLAVGARADGRPFSDRDLRALDALAERLSATLSRLRLSDAVASGEQKIADVLTSATDGIYSTTPEGRIASWNPAMERITGIDARDALGDLCCRVFRPTSPEREPRYGISCPGRTGGTVGAIDLVLPVEGSDDRWLTASFSPLKSGGYVAVVRDVTAERRLEALKEDFLATVSHELRTPLTPIRGFLATLTDGDERMSAEQRSKIYEVLGRQTHRLERMITDLLMATSLQGAELAIVPGEVEWDRALESLVEAHRAEAHGHTIDLEVESPLGQMWADPERAEQIVANLLTNGLNHTPEGTTVTVRTRQEGDWIVTTVADDGPGVPDEEHDRIFERFVRLGNHLTRPDGGAGLGLFIARRLAEAMGGEIDIDLVDEGASFTLRLPAAGTDPASDVEEGVADMAPSIEGSAGDALGRRPGVAKRSGAYTVSGRRARGRRRPGAGIDGEAAARP